MFPKEITKDQINELPLERYEGPVELVDSETLFKAAIKDLRREQLLGFDTEARPTFKKGDYHPLSLLQIGTADRVFLFRLNKIGLGGEIAKIFATPEIVKVGVSVQDDIKELQKLRRFQPASVLDLNDLAEQNEIKNKGVRNLTALFLGFRVSKSQQTTNWERDELTMPQIRYAATDAWVCYEIFKRMQAWDMV
jgi:ribonuclease D